MIPILYLDTSRYIKKVVHAIILAEFLALDDKDGGMQLIRT